jgi:hypothetical protein
MRERTKGFISGILVSAAILGTLGTATASTGKMTKTVEYNNIGVMVNGKKVDLKDANGNTVEPFMIGGTNYLPVRAVGETLGMDVSWNSKSKTVVMTGGSDTNKMRCMNFYHQLYVCFAGYAEVLSNMENNISGYQTTEAKSTILPGLDRTIKTQISNLNSLYSGLVKDGLTSSEDVNIMGEFNRLASLTSSKIETLMSSTSSSAINSVQYGAITAAGDALGGCVKTSNSFNLAYWKI